MNISFARFCRLCIFTLDIWSKIHSETAQNSAFFNLKPNGVEPEVLGLLARRVRVPHRRHHVADLHESGGPTEALVHRAVGVQRLL